MGREKTVDGRQKNAEMGKNYPGIRPGIGKNIIGPKRALNSQENQFLRLKRAKMPKTNKRKNMAQE